MENDKMDKIPEQEQPKMCQVVSDLLPAYVEGECTQGSRELVEEHVKTCENCAGQLSRMGMDLRKILPEPSREDVEKIDALRKVKKKNDGRLAAAVMAMVMIAIVVFCVAAQIYVSFFDTDRGPSKENKVAREKGQQMMEVLQEDGVEAFVNEMEPLYLYEDLCTPRKNYFEKTELWVNMAMRRDAQREMQITLGKGENARTYWITDQAMIANLLNTQQTQKAATWAEQKYLDSGDMNEFVYYEIKTPGDYSGIDFILSEDEYQYLVETFGEIEDPWIETMEIDGKRYYYRTDIGKSDNGKSEEEAARAYLEDFPEDMRRIVPEIRELDTIYIYIARSSIVPDELQQLKKEYLAIIDGWYQQYAAYYQDMGYEAFAGQWKTETLQKLQETFQILGDVETVEMDDVWPDSRGDDYRYGLTDEDRSGWNMIWNVQCGNGSCKLFLNVDDAGELGYVYLCNTTYSNSSIFDYSYTLY